MFCSKCGKTLNAAAQHCSCGQVVGESRFEGVPYTSAQARIAPGDSARSAEGALPYTRTTYTGMDEQLQAGADVDARTTYRPVYEGSSVPEGIRRDVRAAVGYESGAEGSDLPEEVDPLVREMFRGEDAGIDDFDLSQLRPRPIVSEGRAGISRDVSEYVERLAESDKGPRRSRRRKVYGEGEIEDGAPYEEVREEVFQDVEEDAPVYDAGGTMRLVAKIAGALALIAVLIVGGKMIFDKVNEIRTGGAPIPGVTLQLYEDGMKMISEHADAAYIKTILTSAQEGYNTALATLRADASAVEALLPAEPAANDKTFVDALSAIQTNIGNAVTMDVLDISAGTVDAATVAKSEERWMVVQNAIAQLGAAKTAEELTAIIGGETIEVITPTEPTATATPIPYQTLTKNDKNEDVRKLQQRLYELGFLEGGIDGQFGSKTQTAVKRFQEWVELEQTGIADPVTQARIFADDAPRSPYAPATQAPVTQAPTQAPEPTPDIAAEPTLLSALLRAAA